MTMHKLLLLIMLVCSTPASAATYHFDGTGGLNITLDAAPFAGRDVNVTYSVLGGTISDPRTNMPAAFGANISFSWWNETITEVAGTGFATYLDPEWQHRNTFFDTFNFHVHEAATTFLFYVWAFQAYNVDNPSFRISLDVREPAVATLATPIPAALPMFAGALVIGGLLLRRRRNEKRPAAPGGTTGKVR